MARFARWAFCGLVCLGQTTAQELSGPGPCPRARLVPCVLHLHSRRAVPTSNVRAFCCAKGFNVQPCLFQEAQVGLVVLLRLPHQDHLE